MFNISSSCIVYNLEKDEGPNRATEYYTSSLVYVLSVMKQNSSTRGAQISSYFLKTMKEKKHILDRVI